MVKNKKKTMIILFLLLSIVFGAGITYSLYSTEATVTTGQIGIANFIFNTSKTNLIELPVTDILPGENITHTFSVANNLDAVTSDVTVEYQIKFKTLHVIPLTYELVSMNGIETILFTCNELNTRNVDGILECETSVIDMVHGSTEVHNYELRVSFPSAYNDAIYANLIDYVDLEIDSWQKVE